jgi:predicted PurR-regulated permease PerM
MSQPGEGTYVTVKPMVPTPLWKHALWLAVAVVGLWALSKIPSTLIVFSLAWLIAYLLNPVVDRLTGRRLGPIASCSRGQAVGIVAGLLLGCLVAMASLVVPQLTEQVNKLISLQHSLGDPSELPLLLRQKAEPLLALVPEQYRETAMIKATNFIQESASKIGQWAAVIITAIGAFLGQLLSAIFLVCSAFLVSLYMLMNWNNLAAGFIEKLPRQYQREVLSLSVKLNEIFGGYLKATILTALACMVATFIALLITDLVMPSHDFPYKGLVAFVAGISYPVPVIGIIATSILGGVLGFVSPGGTVTFGLVVLAVINVVNILIDRTVQPALMSDAIGVSELFVMFAAFAGGEVAGVWGMLLGIPVAAMGKTLFEWFHLNFLLVDDHDPLPHDELPEPARPLEGDTVAPPAASGLPSAADHPTGASSVAATTVVNAESHLEPPPTVVEVHSPAPPVAASVAASGAALEAVREEQETGKEAFPEEEPFMVDLVNQQPVGEPSQPTPPQSGQPQAEQAARAETVPTPVDRPNDPSSEAEDPPQRSTRRLSTPPPLPPGPPVESKKKRKKK